MTGPSQSPLPAPRARLLDWLSLPLLFALWQGAALLADSRLLPGPLPVLARAMDLAASGPLLVDFAATLTRALAGFVIAMALGTALGLALGRVRALDRLFGPWVLAGMNLPAIVVAILCYIGLGLTEFALVLAVVINKTPLVATTLREGSRALSPDLDELAAAFRMPFARRLALVHLPQLAPYLMSAARTGLALTWKIVLVFEVLGSDGGAGFRISIYFQNFDMAGILAYTLVFTAMVMGVEHAALRPLERRARRWRKDLS